MIKQFFYFLVLVIITFTLYEKYKKKNEDFSQKFTPISKLQNDKRPYLWIYLEPDINARKWPSFQSRLTTDNVPNCLQLSIESIYKFCSTDFNIIQLSPDNLNQYIPELEIEVGPYSKTNIQQKYQIISSLIIYKYGGLWLPPWVIIMKSLKEIINKLLDNKIVVFGCPNRRLRCLNDSYSNIEVIGSLPKNNLMLIYYRKLITNNKLYLNSAYNYYNSGRCLFWGIFKNNQSKLYHFDSKYDGTRDYNGKKITNEELFSINNIFLEDKDKCMFVLYNYFDIYKSIYYKWFLRMSKKQIFNSNLWIGKLYRQSLLNEVNNDILYNTSTRNT